METSFFDSNIYTYGVIPLLIFLARLCDVSIGTVRILSLARGHKRMTVVLSFFEIMIWLVAIRQIFQNLDNPVCYVAFAGGFAMGSYVGMIIEQKLALGSAIIRVVTAKPADELIAHLKQLGHRYTCLDAQGSMGDVNVIFMILKRKDVRAMLELIRQYNPKAFYTVEDVQVVSDLQALNVNAKTRPQAFIRK